MAKQLIAKTYWFPKGTGAAGPRNPSLGMWVPPCAGNAGSQWIKPNLTGKANKRRGTRSHLWSKAALGVLAFGDLSSWYQPASLSISCCRVDSAFWRDRWATGSSSLQIHSDPKRQHKGLTQPSWASDVTVHEQHGWCQLCPQHGQVQGETRCHLRQ